RPVPARGSQAETRAHDVPPRPGVLGALARHRRHRPDPGRRQRPRYRARGAHAPAPPAVPRTPLGNRGRRRPPHPLHRGRDPAPLDPLLHLLGGLLLLWIAAKLVRQDATDEAHVRHGASLAEAVWIILIADVAMSLDNVVAVAAAARGDLLLVTFGISLSIPVVVWGSGILARLMTRAPWIVWL